MGQSADTLEREIVASRDRMSHTIDLMEKQLRRTMDWKTKIAENPVPYVAGAAAVVYLLIGGPKKTLGLLRGGRHSKSKLEKLVDQLPEPLADKLSSPVHDVVANLQDVPDNLKKVVREAQKEREKLQHKEDEERLRRAARATMLERVAIKAAEAAGTAAAGLIAKRLADRLSKDED